MDRLTFRQIEQRPGIGQTRTSGSTGQAVVVNKYMEQREAYMHTQRLVQLWHGFRYDVPTIKLNCWYDEPIRYGDLYCSGQYIDGPWEQLQGFPSLFPRTGLEQFKCIVSYGEPWTGVGIDLYSSEEFGNIALQCPHNKDVLHVMPHLVVDCHSELGLIITDTTHPYLKEYEIGDHAEHTTCGCDIDLPAITHVRGRIRNLIKMPDGTTKWPRLGLYGFDWIKRFQVRQVGRTKLIAYVDGLVDDQVKARMRSELGYDFEIEVRDNEFPLGKHEEFICEI